MDFPSFTTSGFDLFFVFITFDPYCAIVYLKVYIVFNLNHLEAIKSGFLLVNFKYLSLN